MDLLSDSNDGVKFCKQVIALFCLCIKDYIPYPAFSINGNEEIFYSFNYFAFLFFSYIPTNRKTQKSSVMWMLVSLCSSMLVFNIIFIAGIENRNARDHSNSNINTVTVTISNTLLTSDLVDPPTNSWFTAVAVLLHYLLLAKLMWSALSSAQLYFLLLRAMKPLPEHFLKTMSVIRWGKI